MFQIWFYEPRIFLLAPSPALPRSAGEGAGEGGIQRLFNVQQGLQLANGHSQVIGPAEQGRNFHHVAML